jgi:hypothetical protein
VNVALASLAGLARLVGDPGSGAAGQKRCRNKPSPHLQVHWEQTVDVAPILDKAVAAKKEKLEWRTSIVDLMKPLDIEPCGAQ